MADVIGQVVLKNVRCSFLKVWTATESKPGGKKQYRSNFIIDPSTPEGKANIKACEKAVAEVAAKQWSDKGERVVKTLKSDRLDFRPGDTFVGQESGEVYDGYEGMMIVKAANPKRVRVLDRDKSDLHEEDEKIESGDYCDAVVRFYTVADTERGGNGVFASLELVRFRKQGERFGAAPVSADVLDDLDDEEEDDPI